VYDHVSVVGDWRILSPQVGTALDTTRCQLFVAPRMFNYHFFPYTFEKAFIWWKNRDFYSANDLKEQTVQYTFKEFFKKHFLNRALTCNARRARY